jgi:hypothetical protein
MTALHGLTFCKSMPKQFAPLVGQGSRLITPETSLSLLPPQLRHPSLIEKFDSDDGRGRMVRPRTKVK